MKPGVVGTKNGAVGNVGDARSCVYCMDGDGEEGRGAFLDLDLGGLRGVKH